MRETKMWTSVVKSQGRDLGLQSLVRGPCLQSLSPAATSAFLASEARARVLENLQ